MGAAQVTKFRGRAATFPAGLSLYYVDQMDTSVKEPPNVSGFNGKISVNWTNPSGTEVIGSWNTSVALADQGEEVTNYQGVIGNGKIKPFSPVFGPDVAW